MARHTLSVLVEDQPGVLARVAALFSRRYGQTTGVVVFDDVFVPHERVFMAGEVEEAGFLTTSYATHHRHTCIGARAGFGVWPSPAAAISITCRRCSAASGHSEATWAVSFLSAAWAAGLPTLTAMSKFSVRAPQMPPWPLQRSITATRVLGARRSISAALGPMFCARAWQARWTVTPSGSGRIPSGSPYV